MRINFCVQKSDKFKVAVTGHDSYDEKMDIYSDKYTFENTVTLNLLYKVNSKEEYDLTDASFCEHTDLEEDYTFMTFTEDGLYKIRHVIIPTKEYLQEIEQQEGIVFYGYNNGSIYKRLNGGNWQKVSIKEISEVNAFGLFYDEIYTFTLTQLKECFAKICEDLLCDLCDGCYNNKNTQNVLNRDLVWMAINCIEYTLEEGNFIMAQKMLERISTCSGPCSSRNNKCKQNNTGGCNCGKH